LLVVVALIAGMAVFALPAFSSLQKSSQLTQSGQRILDTLVLTRQRALTSGRNFEIRFYKFQDKDLPGGTPYYKAMQVFEETGRSDTGGNPIFEPVGRLYKLPNSVMIDQGSPWGNEWYSLSTIVNPSDSGNSREEPSSNIRRNEEKVQINKNLKQGTDFTFTRLKFRPSGGIDLDPDLSWYFTIRDPQSGADGLTAIENVPNYITFQLEPYTGIARLFRP